MTGVETGDVTRSVLANLRDLGGLRVTAGTVRAGMLWRADDLSLSPRDEVVDLHARGVRVVLDLRSMTESERSTGEHALAVGFDCHQISLLETEADPVAMASMLGDIATADDMGRWYATMAELGAATIVRGLELVASRTRRLDEGHARPPRTGTRRFHRTAAGGRIGHRARGHTAISTRRAQAVSVPDGLTLRRRAT